MYDLNFVSCSEFVSVGVRLHFNVCACVRIRGLCVYMKLNWNVCAWFMCVREFKNKKTMCVQENECSVWVRVFCVGACDSVC
jgi:hypothetical protein